jgi:hypothetical protein
MVPQACRRLILGAATSAVAAVLFATSPAQAALSVYEGFDGSPTGFQTAFPADGAQLAGSLSYGPLVTSGGSRAGSGGGYQPITGGLLQTVNVTNAYNGVYSSSGTVWMTWLYKTPAQILGGLDNGWTRMVTIEGPTEHWNLGQIDNNGPKIMARGDFLAGQGNSDTFATSPDTTYLIVARYAFGAQAVANDGQITLWVNPDVSSLGSGLAPTGGTQLNTAAGLDESMMAFNTVQFVMNGLSTGTVNDELRIASTWAEASPAVPEPVAMGLLALSSLALLRRRSL